MHTLHTACVAQKKCPISDEVPVDKNEETQHRTDVFIDPTISFNGGA